MFNVGDIVYHKRRKVISTITKLHSYLTGFVLSVEMGGGGKKDWNSQFLEHAFHQLEVEWK